MMMMILLRASWWYSSPRALAKAAHQSLTALVFPDPWGMAHSSSK